MKSFFCVSFLLALASTGHATDLKMRAIYKSEQLAPPRGTFGNQADFQKVIAWIYITNHDEADIRIPTWGSQKVQVNRVDGTGSTFGFLFGSQPNPLNLPVVMPEAELGIVTLKKGEITFLRYETVVDRKLDFSRLIIIYEIVGELARRHNLWGGRLVVEAEPYEQAIPKKD